MLQENLLRLYSDQLLKAEGDIKNNPHLTKEIVEYRNKHGMLVRKTVYKNHEPTQLPVSTYEALTSHQDLLAGDVIRCTTKSGKVVTGAYTRKTSQVKKGVKTEYLEFIKSDGSKGYVTLNGSVKLERQTTQALDQASGQAKSSLTLSDSLVKLAKLGCRVQTIYASTTPGPLMLDYQRADLDLNEVYEGIVKGIQKSTANKITVPANNFYVKEYANKVLFELDHANFKITRTIKLDLLEVKHDYFKVNEKYQDGGLGKDLFRVFYKQYQALGIKKVSVSANIDIGGYSWMAYGFSATTSQAASIIAGFARSIDVKYNKYHTLKGSEDVIPTVKKDVDLLQNAFNSWKQDNPNDGFFPMNILTSAAKASSNPLAFKAYIINNRVSWEGQLDLTNKARREYFETYIGYNK